METENGIGKDASSGFRSFVGMVARRQPPKSPLPINLDEFNPAPTIMPTPTAIAERSQSADRRSHVIAAIIGCIIMASGLPRGTCRSRAAEPQQQPDTRFRETTTIDWDAIEPPPPPTGSPNVLLIVADDLGGRVGWEGHRSVKTPNLDALAARGRWYRHAYCQQSVCNPSRASMLTGRSLDRLGIADLETHFRRRDADIVTLPQSFKRAGYHVHGIGKIFHNFKQDAFRGDPSSWTAASILHYGSHGWDTPRVDGAIPPDELDPPVPRATRRDVPDDAYLDGRVATAAVDRLKQLARRDRPFFLAVGMWKPHTPFNAPSKYWAMYDDVDIAPPHPPEPPLGVPPIALHDNWEMMRAFKRGINARQTRLLRQGYYAAITYMDAQVGRVLDELDRSGLRDDTIVVFTSDHGYHLGEHALWCKTSNFELDARVPLIVSGPGIEPSPSPTGA